MRKLHTSIDKSIRATNYLIDQSIILTLWIGIQLILQQELSLILFYLITYFYYFILEAITRQTIGKLVTKTVVVKKNGVQANLLNICIRSVLRLFPFDAFTYVFGTERGFHDILSSTRLIKKIKTNKHSSSTLIENNSL